jgi:ribosomal-protein-alanine N-acetyltransferase
VPQPVLPLEGGFLLRPWESRDAAAVRRAFDDPDIQFWHTRRLASDAEAGEWLASWRQRWHEESAASWAIARAADGAAVGQVGLRMV